MNSKKTIDFDQDHDDFFEKIVMEALELMPENFATQLNNVEIVVEETQPEHIKSFLLGLYHGVPRPYKGIFYSFVLPDKISLYKNNIIQVANQRQIPLKQVIAEVLYHEIGHYFGLSESELDSFRSF